ncbi:MAG: tRNA (adenosine(37)-N6)-threonylcarbamoyltransferase complex dimerization subunit type 1 TsaB [Limisphaerales bacterium]
MTILALEFSSAQRSVALARAGCVLAEESEIGGRETHAFGMIEKILAAAKIGCEEVECLAVGLGPGSYTGVRVALAIAQGWQLAREVKLLGISSAECLAAQAQAEKIYGRVNMVIDAQRGEFYLATYEVAADGAKEITPLKIVTAVEVESRTAAGEILIGPDVMRWFAAAKNFPPSATALALLAAQHNDFMAGEKLEPVYLRATNFLKIPAQRKA